MHEFFSCNFPLREYFFCTSPPPPAPAPHKFSNGPSLSIILKQVCPPQLKNWVKNDRKLLNLKLCLTHTGKALRYGIYVAACNKYPLKVKWLKFHRRHLHQFRETGRNFVTDLRVNSRLITHARMQT